MSSECERHFTPGKGVKYNSSTLAVEFMISNWLPSMLRVDELDMVPNMLADQPSIRTLRHPRSRKAASSRLDVSWILVCTL